MLTYFTKTRLYLCVQLPPLYRGQCILANGVDRTQDLSIGNLACYHRAIQSPKFFRHGEPKYLSCTWLLKQDNVTKCSLKWSTQLRWICDVIRHNFKWNVCDVMKQKDLKEFYYVVTLNSFPKTLMYLKTSRLVLFRVKINFSEVPFSRDFLPKMWPNYTYYHSLRLT